VGDAWLPGAGRIRGTADGGPLKGGAPRVVWHTLGIEPRAVPARSAALRLRQADRACHLVWNPLQGEITQLLPVVSAGRLLGWPEELDEMTPSPPAARGMAAGKFAEVNTEGRLCVQIGVVALAWDPFTSWPLCGLQQILGWLDSWGIPRQWPAGQPAAFPLGLTAPKDRRLWARGGHFGASQVPSLAAAGPGAVDVAKLTGRAARTAPVAVPTNPDAALRAVPGEMRDLDGYLQGDRAGVTRQLSRVG